jgi:hypothetical protein
VIDGRFDVICSGSLLGIVNNKKVPEKFKGSIPVGYEQIEEMYSLDFEEFLLNSNFDYSKIKEKIIKKEKIENIINVNFLEKLKTYMVVGGMPEAVVKFLETRDYNQVFKVQQNLLSSYSYDISQYCKDTMKTKVREVFNSIPKQLSKKGVKFKYSNVKKRASSRTHEVAID